MCKLILTTMLVCCAFAWAQQSGGDWYNQHLTAQVEQLSRINATVAPSQTAYLHETFRGEEPGSMAANVASGEDWYNMKIAAQTELAQRDLAVIKGTAGFAQQSFAPGE